MDRLASRVAARYVDRVGMEFDSPEALQKYLHDHPGADKSLHSVKKPEKSEGQKPDEKKDDFSFSENDVSKAVEHFHGDKAKDLSHQEKTIHDKIEDFGGRGYKVMPDEEWSFAEGLAKDYKDSLSAYQAAQVFKKMKLPEAAEVMERKTLSLLRDEHKDSFKKAPYKQPPPPPGKR